jgi:chromosome segregation and condensation protein ScpB
MRLTYRTVRVLAAIAAQPGLSSSQIRRRAGIAEQGQISRLLSRLAGLQLIENTGQARRKGSASAWRLTHRGEAVERTIRHERLPRRS